MTVPSTEISPEANRQKATVQIKVKMAKPDNYLRPEINATVAFVADRKRDAASMVTHDPHAAQFTTRVDGQEKGEPKAMA
jgi:hypothetical protein